MNDDQIMNISLLSAVLFFVVANEILFNFVDGLLQSVGLQLGPQLLVVVHSLVFGLLLGLSMKYVLPMLNNARSGQ